MNTLLNYNCLNSQKQFLSNDTGMYQQAGINKNIKIGEQFMEILENGNITTVFQPIISLKDGRVLGYEALNRGPKNSSFENPEYLFDLATMHGKLW